MAAAFRRLVFVLTMVAWLAASIRTGSSRSGWWGSHEALELRQAARRFSTQGNFDEAERTYRHGADLALLHRDQSGRAWFLAGAGDANLVQFRFRAAISAYLDAQHAAGQARDPLVLGAVQADLASAYQQMGDFDSALRAAEQARVLTSRLPGVYYRPHLLLLLGHLRADATSIPLYREAIQEARGGSAKDPSLAVVQADGWDLLTEGLLDRGDLDGAEAAAQKAIELRRLSEPQGLGFPEWRLAQVRIRQAEQAVDRARREQLLRQAQSFNDAAARERRGPPAYALAGQRGRILLLLGREREGLEALETSIQQAQRWRQDVVATPGALDSSAVQLQNSTFQQFIDAAAAYGMDSPSPRWMAESLEAAELNRTVNLRDNALSSRSRKLPAAYWDALGQLRNEELRLSRAKLSGSPLSNSLRLSLSEMESRSGLGYSPKLIENFPTQASLIHFQSSLTDSDLFLSIALGEQASWLWAVTSNSLRVYRLPAAGQIVSTVRDFRKAISSRTGGAQGTQVANDTGYRRRQQEDELGHRLYGMLFGQLPSAQTSRTDWQLSVDDVLLELPFAALVPELGRGRQPQFLVERHSLQIEAGALAPPTRPTLAVMDRRGGFLGVGDPIYNAADTRWTGQKSRAWGHWFSLTALAGNAELNRLPGTGREVERSAHAWQAEGATATLLEGADATPARFLQALATKPGVIHLATHAAPSGNAASSRTNASSPGDASIFFSLGHDGAPQMLGTSEISSLSIPGSLVAMTGCDTAPSRATSGLGLAGLVRAWIIAGAGSVLATEWPVQDPAQNSLLPNFYRALRSSSTHSAAAALRLAQIEAIRSGTAPISEWAAYQVFTGHTATGSELP